MPPLRRKLTLANIFDENQPEQIIKYNAAPPSTGQPLALTNNVFKSSDTTTTFPHQSSPLGPHQCSLPGQPVFPPSVRKPNFYCQALERSHRRARQAKKYMRKFRNMEKERVGKVEGGFDSGLA